MPLVDMIIEHYDSKTKHFRLDCTLDFRFILVNALSNFYEYIKNHVAI